MRKTVRGPYHQRLRAVLKKATESPGCDQTSLAEVLVRDQSGLSNYLKDKGRPMDLDQAHIALEHCGLGGLREFVLETPPPPVDRDLSPRLLSFLRHNGDVRQLLEDLLDARPQARSELLLIATPFLRARRRTRRGGRPPGSGGGTRTTKGSKPRQ
jgi:hypothetical protein